MYSSFQKLIAEIYKYFSERYYFNIWWKFCDFFTVHIYMFIFIVICQLKKTIKQTSNTILIKTGVKYGQYQTWSKNNFNRKLNTYVQKARIPILFFYVEESKSLASFCHFRRTLSNIFQTYGIILLAIFLHMPISYIKWKA